MPISRVVPLAFATMLGVLAARHGAAAACAAPAVLLACVPPTRLLTAGLLAGIIIALLHPDLRQADHEQLLRHVELVITGDVRRDDAGVSAPAVTDAGACVRARFASGTALAPGERLIVRGQLVPFDVPRNPGEPSERALARDDGLVATLLVRSIAARAPPQPFDERTLAARARAASTGVLRRAIREPEASILAGALWGERGTLPAALHDDFQVTGTVHVLVTAGLHLGIVAGAVLGLLWLIALPRPLSAVIASVTLVAYVWFSGAHLPSQRACAMALVVLAARALGARARPGDALGIAALAVLVIDPGAVESVSFALSFSCVAAIACFAGPVATALETRGVPARLGEPLALTIATQLGVWPLSAAVFGTLAPYAIVANAAVVPAIGIAMPLGAVALIATAVSPCGAVLAQWTTWIVAAIVAVVHAVAALPGARVTIPPPPAFAVVLYDVLALLAAAALRAQRIAIAFVALGAGAGIIAVAARPPLPRVATITVLDVGQGDGIVLQTPRGHVVLIDAGGRLERGPAVDGRSPAERVGERVVLGYLRRRGIPHVDVLLLTHPHGDHVGGCAPIVAALRVDAIVDTAQSYGGRAYTDCLRVARERHVPVITARAGMRWTSGDGLTLDLLAPELPLLADTGDDVNENSAVVRATYDGEHGPVRALLTGDAGAASEDRLLHGASPLRADILKVGHHGSRFASTAAFLAAVRPTVALVSVGRHNVFGHPAAATLAALRTAGAAAWRTDACGALTVPMALPVRVEAMVPCR